MRPIRESVVEAADVRRVVRCPHCGFKTFRVHDRRQLRVVDPPRGAVPSPLMWIRRRFSCGECGERS
ncbi:MAG: hypothetical protein GEU79_16945 [Acidimicrobiia bacterium]|nr:hypothetical protein [Acidimicrobiia bacterium]